MATPRCGICGRLAVLKTSRYGKFFSCSAYPLCTGSCNVSKQGKPYGSWRRKTQAQPITGPEHRLTPRIEPRDLDAQAVAGGLTLEQIESAASEGRTIDENRLHTLYGFDHARWLRFRDELVDFGAQVINRNVIQLAPASQ